jgi:hypothetical protein
MENFDMKQNTVEDAEKATAALLLMYQEYMLLDQEIVTGEAQIRSGTTVRPTIKINLRVPQKKMVNLDPYAEKKERRDAIGEAMKFSNPMVWMLYKHRAYKDTSKHNETLHDFLEHTKVELLCGKRNAYLNTYLTKNRGVDLWAGTLIPLDTNLETAAQNDLIAGLCNDEAFMRGWNLFEYSPTGKWVGYKT